MEPHGGLSEDMTEIRARQGEEERDDHEGFRQRRTWDPYFSTQTLTRVARRAHSGLRVKVCTSP